MCAAAPVPRNRGAPAKDRERDALLLERVERLMTIPAVGSITALTWALEIGDVRHFSSIKKAISYCGLCDAEKSSGNTVQPPLSKQRHKHLQTTLIEAAKLAPRNSPDLPMLYHREQQKGNANRATLAVARKGGQNHGFIFWKEMAGNRIARATSY
jgi:transposase